MKDKYLIVREDKKDGQIYVNGVEDTLDNAKQWIYDANNFDGSDTKYTIYKKVDCDD